MAGLFRKRKGWIFIHIQFFFAQLWIMYFPVEIHFIFSSPNVYISWRAVAVWRDEIETLLIQLFNFPLNGRKIKIHYSIFISVIMVGLNMVDVLSYIL